MYEDFFQLSAAPFKLNPDPRFFFGSRSHNKAMAYLHYGLRQAEGFIVITGEIGAGKSMLIGHLLDQLDRSNVVAAHLLTPNLTSDALISHILSAFRIEPANDGKTGEIEAFEDFLFDQLNRGRRVLLIVDEAQNLPKETLEELRILSNMDYDGSPLFQVFLVGQPDFRPVLAGAGMEQLRQRIIASYHLKPLNRQETQKYIEHRLTVVGWGQVPVFTVGAYDEIYEETGGVPRKINKLCNRLLLSCSMEGQTKIDTRLANSVIKDMSLENVEIEPDLTNVEDFEDYPPNINQLPDPIPEFEQDDETYESVSGDLKNSMDEALSDTDKDNHTKVDDHVDVIVPFAPVTRISDRKNEGDLLKPEPLVSTAPENGIDASLGELEMVDERVEEPSLEAPLVGESLLDTLKRRGKMRNKPGATEKASPKTDAGDRQPARTLAPQDDTQPATIDDVANAIAAVGNGTAEIDDAPKITKELASVSAENTKSEIAAFSDIPAMEDNPKGWRKSVVKSINDTRNELKEAHSNVSRVRLHLVEIERARQERNAQINASLSRAEMLLSEIRDSWR